MRGINRKGTAAFIVAGIFVFYALILMMYVSFGSSSYRTNIDLNLTAKPTEAHWYSNIPGGEWVASIVRFVSFTITGLPWWFNLLVFGSLSLVVSWIIAEWLRGTGS
jgi:hypothetical protein